MCQKQWPRKIDRLEEDQAKVFVSMKGETILVSLIFVSCKSYDQMAGENTQRNEQIARCLSGKYNA
jgi:hypothetical protein